MTITPIQAKVTKTAAFAGASVDVSGITGDWTLKLQVSKLTAAKNVRFQFTDSVDAFTTPVAGPTYSFSGEIVPSADKVHSIKKQDFPNLRMGVANGVLRLEISLIDAAASVDYSAWLESA